MDKTIFSLYAAAQDLSSDSFHARVFFLAKQLVSPDSAAILSGTVFSKKHRRTVDDEATSSEWERELCSIILPHLFQAREINDRIFSRRGSTGGLDKISLVASLDGRVCFLEENAMEMLQTEWPDWTPPLLPPLLMDAFTTERAGGFTGRVVVARAAYYENMLCVQVSKKAAIPRLSNAESEAAQLVADGLTYKEAARRLNRAPATVRNQLHSAYQKLGITNKNGLRAALASTPAEPFNAAANP
jgi:DNA-binding CsgD family transcriptional regulator